MFEAFKRAGEDYKQAKADWRARNLDLEKRKREAPQEPVYYRRGVLGLHQIDAADISGRDIARGDIAVGFRPVNYVEFGFERLALEYSRPDLLNTYFPALWTRSNESLAEFSSRVDGLPILIAAKVASKFAEIGEKSKKQKKQ